MKKLISNSTIYYNSEFVKKDILIDGLTIHYNEEGEENQSAILLLHGWGSNSDLFRGIINHLSSNYTVYALDMPGFGKTAEPKTVWCVDDYVDFIIKFIVCLLSAY